MANKLSMECTGILMKLQSAKIRENILSQVQIKCTDRVEISEIFKALEGYGVENLRATLPALDIPWNKMTVPVDDYGIFLDIKFGVDPYTGEPGAVFKAKLMSMNLVRKTDKENNTIVECCFNFLKNEDAYDIDTRFMFLKHKEEDENGKKKLKLFGVKMDTCEHFLLGSETEKDDESDDSVPEVYAG